MPSIDPSINPSTQAAVVAVSSGLSWRAPRPPLTAATAPPVQQKDPSRRSVARARRRASREPARHGWGALRQRRDGRCGEPCASPQRGAGTHWSGGDRQRGGTAARLRRQGTNGEAGSRWLARRQRSGESPTRACMTRVGTQLLYRVSGCLHARSVSMTDAAP